MRSYMLIAQSLCRAYNTIHRFTDLEIFAPNAQRSSLECCWNGRRRRRRERECERKESQFVQNIYFYSSCHGSSLTIIWVQKIYYIVITCSWKWKKILGNIDSNLTNKFWYAFLDCKYFTAQNCNSIDHLAIENSHCSFEWLTANRATAFMLSKSW